MFKKNIDLDVFNDVFKKNIVLTMHISDVFGKKYFKQKHRPRCFWRCLKKTLTSMFLTMFKKNENIVLTMHISDVFGKKYFKQIEICNKSYEICNKLW